MDCGPSTSGATAEYQAARAADVTATTLKGEFVAAFNPSPWASASDVEPIRVLGRPITS